MIGADHQQEPHHYPHARGQPGGNAQRQERRPTQIKGAGSPSTSKARDGERPEHGRIEVVRNTLRSSYFLGYLRYFPTVSRKRPQVSASASGSTRAEPIVVMKLVSPRHRGTT